MPGISCRKPLYLWLGLLAGLAGGCVTRNLPEAPEAGATPSAWKREPGSVALMQKGQPVWQFNFGSNATKPFFHPVALPGGPVLTWDQPGDHPWHRALWFSWKFINGINYWEEDPKTGVSAGRTRWSEPQIETRRDFSARIRLRIVYQPANEPPVLTERREIEISPPDQQGAYFQDWTLTFTAADRDVLLDRTPIPGEPDGKSWGGYAGLSVRLASALKEPSAISTDAAVVFTNGVYRGRARAVDYSGRFAGQEAGIAILDSPGNLNSPSPWYAINDGTMCYFSPAVICYRPHLLKAGSSLRLRYRVIAHPGRWNASQLRQAAERFAAD